MRHLSRDRCLSAPIVLAAFLLAATGVSPSAVGEDGVPVYAVPVSVEPLYQQLDLTGTVGSQDISHLAPEISGRVARVHAEAGDQVVAGAPLLSLDDELAGLRLAAANARVEGAEAALADARRRLQEAEYLGPKGGIAETIIEALRAEVAEDAATLAERKADAQLARAVVTRHRLTAPFSGVISQRDAQRGQWITAGETAYVLINTDRLRLEFPVSEDVAGELDASAIVTVRLNAQPDRPFNAHLDALVPVADPTARTALARVIPDTPVPGMMPGMSVTARVLMPTQAEGIVIPRDALLRHPDGRSVVWTVDDQLRAVEKRVEPGRSFGGRVEILSGLEAHERVVARGNENLRPDQLLKLTDQHGR